MLETSNVIIEDETRNDYVVQETPAIPDSYIQVRKAQSVYVLHRCLNAGRAAIATIQNARFLNLQHKLHFNHKKMFGRCPPSHPIWEPLCG